MRIRLPYFIAGLFLLFFLIGFIKHAFAYTYQDVVDYANNPDCLANVWPCCVPSYKSSHSGSCYSIVSCECEIRKVDDTHYNVYLVQTSFDGNWFDQKKSVNIGCSSIVQNSSPTWNFQGCDGDRLMNDNIGVGNYYCVPNNFTNYARRCDGLFHVSGSGDCNGSCPIRTRTFSAVSPAPDPYDNSNCLINSWTASSGGNCNNIFTEWLKQSFTIILQGSWGTSPASMTKDKGFSKRLKGKKERGFGGYERKP